MNQANISGYAVHIMHYKTDELCFAFSWVELTKNLITRNSFQISHTLILEL